MGPGAMYAGMGGKGGKGGGMGYWGGDESWCDGSWGDGYWGEQQLLGPSASAWGSGEQPSGSMASPSGEGVVHKRKWAPDEKAVLGQFPGTIKSFSAKTGFGFIECEELKKQGYTNDVFLHHSQVGEFAVGSQVLFTAFLSSKGLPQSKDLMP